MLLVFLDSSTFVNFNCVMLVCALGTSDLFGVNYLC